MLQWDDPKGATYKCSCGLRIGRQLNACVNLLQMEGFPVFDAPRRAGEEAERVHHDGEADEGSNELVEPQPMNPKAT
ncbi:MAG: hypothetical protein KIH01_04310 [Candidatus Freyarchaeota archaeon]|nr:hypothetical protein [Candidatus Jordarchaeia archaeon]